MIPFDLRSASTCALAVLLLATPAIAQEKPTIVVRPGERMTHRIAVQRFALAETVPPLPGAAPVAPDDGRRAEEFRAALQAGLRFTTSMETLPDAAFLGPLVTPQLSDRSRSDCPEWRQGGADALVEGVLRERVTEIEVEVAVWDTARCLRLLREVYSRPPTYRSRLARQIADDVVGAISGRRGASATEIAFISTRSGPREVLVMDATGANPRAATRADSIKAFPAWLSDGGGILYTAYVTGTQPSLYVTSRSRNVRAGAILDSILPGRPKYRGVFDPTGARLAFVTSVDGAAEIYAVARDGSSLERLTHSPAIEISPAWSPDGSRIAFVSDRSGSPQIYVMNRDGSDKRRITYEGTYNTGPAWSPDGRWIAYQTRLDSQFDIWLIDPTGEINVPLIQHPLSDESPTWSPDGRKLAFSSTRRGRADIYQVDATGERLERLTKAAGDNIYPAWGPFSR